MSELEFGQLLGYRGRKDNIKARVRFHERCNVLSDRVLARVNEALVRHERSIKQTASLKIDIWTDGDGGSLPQAVSELPELFVLHLEHVRGLCADGYICGEIIDDRFSGWWKIERGEA